MQARSPSTITSLCGHSSDYKLLKEKLEEMKKKEIASNGSVSVKRFVNTAGPNGETPISIATRMNLKETVKLLLRNGAEPTAQDVSATNSNEIKDLLMGSMQETKLGVHMRVSG